MKRKKNGNHNTFHIQDPHVVQRARNDYIIIDEFMGLPFFSSAGSPVWGEKKRHIMKNIVMRSFGWAFYFFSNVPFGLLLHAVGIFDLPNY